MKAEILSIGHELLMGELTDSNSSWIASRLPALGIQVQWMSIIGDDIAMLAEAFRQGLERSDIIFTTGGLGPTQDDLTREAVAAALGETAVVQEEVVRSLEEYFRNRGQNMPATNIKQALLIPSATFIPNRNGTAPGWWAQRNGKQIVIMPGPPAENHAMWDEEVEPRLRQVVDDEVTITRNIKTMGLGEGTVDEMVSEFFGQENPYLGIYSKADGIHLRIIARSKDEATARSLIRPVEEAILDRLSAYVWGFDDETPEQAIGSALKDRGLTMATMESCTGGYLANSITDRSDSDEYFRGGVVAISNQMKIVNGVSAATIKEHGAVSQKTATAMAEAIRDSMSADFGIGIAGGSGSTEEEPLGLAYLAIAGPGSVKEMELRVPPRRVTVKRRISNQALIELKKLVATG